MRDGLKKRIASDKPNTANVFAYARISKNSYNKRVSSNNCSSNSCSNVKDADGQWVGGEQKTKQTSRNYYAPFRQPLKGYRQSTNNPQHLQKDSPNCFSTTEIFKDNYAANATHPTISDGVCSDQLGSISTSKTPLTGTKFASRSSSGYTTRTNKPLIRSGMQPNVAGQQNSGLSGSKTATRYSYSYRELINNRRKDTYTKKIATKQPESGNKTTGYGGDCKTDDGDCNVVYRLNNDKFKVQGAVESSARIERLKLDTIRGSKRCDTGKYVNYGKSYKSECNGPSVPFVRAEMGPTVNNISCTTQRKYKALFNKNHTEVNYPQTSALARARGSVSHQTSINPNGGVCCKKSPQLLM